MPLFPGMTQQQLQQELAIWPLENLYSLNNSLERHFTHIDHSLMKIEHNIMRASKHLNYWQNSPIPGLGKMRKIHIVKHKLDEYYKTKQSIEKEKRLCIEEKAVLNKLLDHRLLKNQHFGC